jgi:hypothetical protein
VSTSATELAGITAGAPGPDVPRAAASPDGRLATQPNLRMYKSEAGFNAIMSWYEETEAKIAGAGRKRVFVDTRFGRTHMLVGRPPGRGAGLADPRRGRLRAALAACRSRIFPGTFVSMRSIFPVSRGAATRIPLPSSMTITPTGCWMWQTASRRSAATSPVSAWAPGSPCAFAIHAPHRVLSVALLGPTGLSSARLPWRIWLTRVMKKSKDADALQDDLTAKSVSSKSPGGSFGTFDRTLARAMALCTRHYRVDWSLGIYDERTRRVDKWKGLKVLGKFFMSEPKGAASSLRLAGPAGIRRARGAV